jgi:Nitrile hydratase, alpha chain
VTTPKEDPEATRIGQEWERALGQLSEADKRLLTLLRLMGEVIDPRYEMKGIRALVGRALVDPAFRARALEDADAALAELRGHAELPENTRVRCVENTADYLTIVLPPKSEALSERSQTVRDFIFSRTSSDLTTLGAGTDDNDVMPVFFDIGTGDHDTFHFGDLSHDGH